MEKQISNGLIKIAKAREDVTDIMQCLQSAESSLSSIEEKAYESINKSDLILNSTKEAVELLEQLSDDYKNKSDNKEIKDRDFDLKIREISNALEKSLKHCYDSNELVGKMEQEVACQREYAKEVSLGLEEVMEGINEAIAYGEVLLMMEM